MRCAIRGDSASIIRERPDVRNSNRALTSMSRLCLLPWGDTVESGSVLMLQVGGIAG